MADLPKRIALVYDRVNKWGGAEQVLLALHKIFPQAPLYTLVHDLKKAHWAKVFPQVVPSVLQHIPFAGNHHEMIPFLSPLGIENLDLHSYDAVISVTSAESKGIRTRPGTFHLCYCLTPTRYLWSHHEHYKKSLGPVWERISRSSFNYLKFWDQVASARPDAYIAISKTVQSRIKKYYARNSFVVFPPVNVKKFQKNLKTHNLPSLPSKYFLYVSRFVSYKRPDVVIEAFNRTGLPLVMVGTGSLNWGIGSLEKKLRKTARSNIHFTGFVSDTDLVYLYQNCIGLVFFHEEDFGIVPVEAQAAGKPVIGLNKGGLSETVIHGRTGLLLNNDSPAALIQGLSQFHKYSFDPRYIKLHSQKFSSERFTKEFVKVFNKEWTKFKNIYTS